MKEKFKKIILIILLLITFTMSDFILLGYKVSIAMYEELESQNTETNVTNVEFDAYFINGVQITHTKENNINNKETLILKINVKEKGSLDNCKIKMENTNFTIIKEEVENQYVKNINVETNEIELNPIIYQNSVEIEVPIKFKKQEEFEEDYFEKENTIMLTGNYLEEDDNVEVSAKIGTRMIWKDEANIEVIQDIEKYIKLDNKILLQQSIITNVQENKLPREEERLETIVPILDNKRPSRIRVLLNGDEIEENKIEYNSETGKLEITEESRGVWSSQINKYKIIYEYEEVEFNNKTINLTTKIKCKLYTQDEIEKEDIQEKEIKQLGNIISIEKQVSESKYKGYLYANSNNKTKYEELIKVEVSNEEEISYIDINQEEEMFVDIKGNEFDIKSKIVYLETMFNKENIINLLGEEGEITIKDENDNVISIIHSQSIENEVGNIVISYETDVKGLKISTTKPINVGTLLIKNKKGIEGNTGFSKEKLKQIISLNSKTKVTTNKTEEIGKAKTNLLDTLTEANLEINNTNLTTLQTNENVQFTVTLKTSSEKYDLYKNPVIEIVLPNSISNVNVRSINKVYADEFGVEYARLIYRDNGEQVIQIALSGEQREYSNEINELSLVINTDIEFDITIPSQKYNFKMTYTNDNGNEEIYNTSVEVNAQSKPGVMIYNNLSGYNNNEDYIYTIDNNVPIGTLNLGHNSNVATVKTSIINNNEVEIKDITIIGRIPKEGVNNATLNTTVLQGINVNIEGIQILYSQNVLATKDDNSWSEDYTNASSYMIKLNNLLEGQVVTLQYQITMPDIISYGQSIYAQTDVTYTYLGNTTTQSSTVGAKSEDVITNNILALENVVKSSINNIDVSVLAVSGGNELENQQSVYEGQKIRYTIQIKNNTGADLNNINIKAIQTNGNLYDLVAYETFDPAVEEKPTNISHLYGELNTNEKSFETIETLINEESIVISYEVVVLEVQTEEQTYGNILITADGMEDINITTIKNTIKQAELKLTMSSSFFEEEKIDYGRKIHMNLDIENISGESLDNVIATVKLPNGIYCDDEKDLVWNSTIVAGEDRINGVDKINNVLYDRESNILSFEMENMEPEEVTSFELYVQVNNFEEAEKDISFMFEASVTNIYVSNMATITIHNEQRNVSVEQNANIDDNQLLKDEDIFDLNITLQNNSQEELCFSLVDNLPEGFTAKNAKLIYQGNEEEIPIFDVFSDEELNGYAIEENILRGEKVISGNSSIEIIVTIEVDSEKIVGDTITNVVSLTYGKLSEDTLYKYDWSYLLETSKEFYMQTEEQSTWVEVVQISNPENNATVVDGQEVMYTFEIKNITDNEILTTFYNYMPKGVVVNLITLNGEELESGDIYVEGHKIGAGETSELTIVGYINMSQVPNNEIVNNLIVSTVMGDVVSNDIIYKTTKESTEEPGVENPDTNNPNQENPENPEDSENNNTSEDTKYSVSGTAWLDKNKDGRRDSTEVVLAGITVKVVDVNTGTYLDDINVTTGNEGHYEINLEQGNYILVFEYNSEKYILTDYKKTGVDDSQNSDVISKNILIDGTTKTVGATDTIEVNGDISNIDIGLIEASIFDLELDKHINEVIVQTNKGTTQYSYGDQTLARVEIHSKEINSAMVIIKYKIRIRNTGEIAGYVQNIVDYIPSDLEFNSELNSDWYQLNGTLHNNSLSNVAINAGEEKTVELVLVKEMNEDNTGTVINIAEIEEATNKLGIEDIDSTPGNNNASEDDYSRTELIIGIATGRITLLITFAFAILTIIVLGIYMINKKVLNKKLI